jgi:NAD+ synthase (glutamine-hydrolysing)
VSRLRLALAQINPTVGDLGGNAELIRQWTRRAADAGADLVAFPEMCLTGYPVEDLALRPSFQSASRAALTQLALDLAADGHGELHTIVGYLGTTESPESSVGRPAGSPLNAAAVLHRGAVTATYAKHHLPNYGVFDEFRYFVPGTTATTFTVAGVEVAIAICEDLWQDGGPVAQIAGSGAGLLVVINGSPYEIAKTDVRLGLCARRARESDMALAYVNQVGGQDELVFDGDSLVVGSTGELIARAGLFDEQLLIADLELPTADHPQADRSNSGSTGTVAPTTSGIESVYRALVTGLRDYVTKNGFRSVLIGISGGIDSALVAAIACDAIGAERVHGLSLPSEYSSDHSLSDAVELAERTGLSLRTVPIAPMVNAYLEAVTLTGLAEENLQARVRGTTLMALSNQEGHLVLATGNKSELSVGYSTIYGDAVGGFAPIKDVPKTLVWELARWRDSQAQAAGQVEPIPANSIEKPPSAELRPGQLDTDSLPDYELLDQILDDYVESDRSAADLVAAGFDAAIVERILRLTDTAEYKRRQYPPGPKVSFKAFGRDRRLPITNAWRESVPD